LDEDDGGTARRREAIHRIDGRNPGDGEAAAHVWMERSGKGVTELRRGGSCLARGGAQRNPWKTGARKRLEPRRGDRPQNHPMDEHGTHKDWMAEEQRRRYEAVFRHAPIGMGIVYRDGHWIEVNPAL
jgi:hypothetical protein